MVNPVEHLTDPSVIRCTCAITIKIRRADGGQARSGSAASGRSRRRSRRAHAVRIDSQSTYSVGQPPSPRAKSVRKDSIPRRTSESRRRRTRSFRDAPTPPASSRYLARPSRCRARNSAWSGGRQRAAVGAVAARCPPRRRPTAAGSYPSRRVASGPRCTTPVRPGLCPAAIPGTRGSGSSSSALSAPHLGGEDHGVQIECAVGGIDADDLRYRSQFAGDFAGVAPAPHGPRTPPRPRRASGRAPTRPTPGRTRRAAASAGAAVTAEIPSAGPNRSKPVRGSACKASNSMTSTSSTSRPVDRATRPQPADLQISASNCRSISKFPSFQRSRLLPTVHWAHDPSTTPGVTVPLARWVEQLTFDAIRSESVPGEAPAPRRVACGWWVRSCRGRGWRPARCSISRAPAMPS